MADRVQPSVNPNATAAKPSSARNHLPYPTRHPYRSYTTSRCRRKDPCFSCRRCLCLTCFWSFFLLLMISLLAAASATVFYALYQPKYSSISVNSLKISYFNLSTNPSDDTTYLTTKFNLTLSVRNPNKKITFYYEPFSISVLSNSIELANGSFTEFTNLPDSIFTLHTTVGPYSQVMDTDSVNSLKADLNMKNGLPLKIVMDTTVIINMGKLKMKKIRIGVNCDGIHAAVLKAKNVIPTTANSSKAKCKSHLRIKILKWIFKL
ncbi:NDR1/HIN1-like protein 6 [Primulina eburnea]|uniref:NDR1/HIN1-like protein 6 n=1 Tax=Primulina eburnea TaxID=1245227 RepID=UPI003C6C6D5D